jgi:hypothetical protein
MVNLGAEQKVPALDGQVDDSYLEAWIEALRRVSAEIASRNFVQASGDLEALPGNDDLGLHVEDSLSVDTSGASTPVAPEVEGDSSTVGVGEDKAGGVVDTAAGFVPPSKTYEVRIGQETLQVDWTADDLADFKRVTAKQWKQFIPIGILAREGDCS